MNIDDLINELIKFKKYGYKDIDIAITDNKNVLIGSSFEIISDLDDETIIFKPDIL